MEKSQECAWPSGLPKLPHPHARSERRDASAHRQRILEVAQQLFAQHGVDAVSMHQIAKAAGVGQGTLYRRYSHKGELCVDLLREHHERFAEEIATMFLAKTTAPALEKLDSVLAAIVAFLEEQIALSMSAILPQPYGLQCDDRENSRRFQSQNTPLYHWLYNVIAGLLTEATERGELGILDIPYTVDVILATLHPMFYHFQRHERGFSTERILQGLQRIYGGGGNA